MGRRFAFALFLSLFLASAPAYSAQAPAAQHWVVVSDVHFDPFADPHVAEHLIAEPVDRWREIFAAAKDAPFSEYGSDTNDALFESALEAMHSTVPDASVVIVSGDFLAHHFREKFDRIAKVHDDASFDAFVDKTEAFLAIEFREAFPRAQLLPVIGNNDNYCGDYESEPNGPFLAHMASDWAPAVSSDAAGWTSQFSTGGYYSVKLPAGGAQAIVLNDIFWSAYYQNACGNAHADPGGEELNWFSAALKSAGSTPVWVIAHIPPGVDTFATLRRKDGQVQMFLADRFNAAFVSALTSPPPNVVMAIAGHTHMDGFRILGPNSAAPVTPMLIVPSVSPIFGNNPSFTVLDVDPATAQVADRLVYTLRGTNWRREYDFDSDFGPGNIGVAHLDAEQTAIFNDERIRRRFESIAGTGSAHAPPLDAVWRAYWCADVALTATDYLACASPQVQTQLPPHPSAPPTSTPTPTPSPSPTP